MAKKKVYGLNKLDLMCIFVYDCVQLYEVFMLSVGFFRVSMFYVNIDRPIQCLVFQFSAEYKKHPRLY